MPDDFDRLLGAALAPEERLPDRRFVSRVQAHVALEERFATDRRAVLKALTGQVLGLAVIGASLWWVGRANVVSDWFVESPALALGTVLTGFAFLTAVIAARSAPASRFRTNSTG